MQENYNNPKHYEWDLPVTTMEVVEEVCKEYKGIEAFYVANILKYIIRAKNKNGIDDIMKVKDYATRLYDHMFKKEKSHD